MFDNSRGIPSGVFQGVLTDYEAKVDPTVFHQREATVALREEIEFDLLVDAFDAFAADLGLEEPFDLAGGGLLAGVSLAIKRLRPQVKIIAVEADNVASFSAALREGKPTHIAIQPTLADGLAIPKVG